MTKDKSIKLSKKQKEILIALRDGTGKFCYSVIGTKFEFNGKTYPYPLGSALAYYSGLIELVNKKSSPKYYKLTAAGKQLAETLK